MRFSLKRIEKPSDKVFILIQAILAAINLSDPEYKTADAQPYLESLPILRHIARISRSQSLPSLDPLPWPSQQTHLHHSGS